MQQIMRTAEGSLQMADAMLLQLDREISSWACTVQLGEPKTFGIKSSYVAMHYLLLWNKSNQAIN